MTESRIKVLIVEDSLEDQEAYRRALSGEDGELFDLWFASLGSEGLAMCSRLPDCVVLDLRLPDMDAIEFLGELRGGRAELPVPVVVVTGQGSESTAVLAMKAGAHDYLVKGAGAGEIRRAIRSARERHARVPESICRVLFIDDSPEDRAIYRRRLSQGPDRYEFLEADTGDDGVEICRSSQPDCVLLDYNLPDTDGLEVLSRLLHQCGPHLAVIMLTGQGNESVAVRALKSGAEDYLVKGPALENLAQSVRAAIEKVRLRKTVEDQRRELERHRNQLRVTLASIGDAVIATDTEARVTFLNPVAEQLTGWSSSDAQGKPLESIFVIVNEETRLPAKNPAIAALKEGRIVGLANHTILIAKDGQEHPIDDSAAPIRDESGEVFGAVLVFRDVGERRRTEQSLLLQSRVLENMTEGVSVADDSGYIFYTNPAEDRMFGYARGELIGKHVTMLNDYPSEENHHLVNEVLKQLRTGTAWVGEWRNKRKDGSNFTTFARISHLEVGEHSCYVCVQEDVTDRRRLEDELQRRVNELAIADKRKDEFLAMLAHELRNPLAPIKNSLHILKVKPGDEKVVEGVRTMMERQVTHLHRLVDDLLDVSRITQGKVKLKLQRLDLGALVRDCVQDRRVDFESAKLHLGIDTPNSPIWVTGDATRLSQVVENFLTNALKFTNAGGEVFVRVWNDGNHARLSVTDTGIGIDPDVLPTIFDVFAQADKTLDRSRGGMGLGLAVVKGLIELHGGSVEAHSEGAGQGSEMCVLLPLEQAFSEVVESKPSTRPPLQRRRVLIIEDNVDSAATLRLLLEVSGYEVQLAHTGPAGIQTAIRWKPDVVVCDIGLPEMDGFAVAQSLRNHAATQDVRLVALTGYGRKEDAARASEAGFDEHIVKPADPDVLLASLSK
jgi:PAS domain S-box-containing protein